MKTVKEFLEEKTLTISITKDGLSKKTYKLSYSGLRGFELSDLSGSKWYAKEIEKSSVNKINIIGFKLKGDKKKVEKILSHLSDNIEVNWK